MEDGKSGLQIAANAAKSIVADRAMDGISKTLPQGTKPKTTQNFANKTNGKNLPSGQNLQSPSTNAPLPNNSNVKTTPETGFRGNRGFELSNHLLQPMRNIQAVVGGRTYTGHALDQMQNRGIMPSVVENAIKTGSISQGNTPGTKLIIDHINKVRVVINESGSVITVY
jgi:hypothetical protein